MNKWRLSFSYRAGESFFLKIAKFDNYYQVCVTKGLSSRYFLYKKDKLFILREKAKNDSCLLINVIN